MRQFTEDQERTLEKAALKYGALNQTDMAIEECAELIQAINKLKRLGGIQNEMQIKKVDANDTHEYAAAYNNLCGEVADVEILIGQMKKMLCKYTIQLCKDRKIERLKERLSVSANRP